MVNQTSFEDMLTEEAHLTSGYQPKHVKFMHMTEGGFASSTQPRHQEEVALPPRPMSQDHAEEISFHGAAHCARAQSISQHVDAGQLNIPL